MAANSVLQCIRWPFINLFWVPFEARRAGLNMQKPRLKKLAPYLTILLAVLVLFVLVGRSQPVRVGDGSEYYGLFYAWELTHRPWMTQAAFDGYEALFNSHRVLGLVSRQALTDAFAALRVGVTADFNHFWFYSLLGVAVAKLVGLVGIVLTIHQSFIGVHMIALVVTLAAGYRYYHWKGVLAVALMLLASPMFWFIDKVHTEFLTVCLVLTGMIFLRTQRYLVAALCMALASTQNPSFALVACIPLFYRVVLQREQAYRFIDVVLAVAVVVAVLAHPVYYFARYGVVTPQLLAGGASMGANLSTFYVWIIDPDLGLLPNWPIGLAVVLTAIGMWIARNPVSGPEEYGSAAEAGARWVVFALLYTAVNLYAHASTQNMNSGATPGLARYALWYLPLGFPLFLRVFQLFPARTKRRYVGVAMLVVATIVSIRINNPAKSEQYWHPSLSSKFIQTHLPGLYNPPWEVFVERFSGFGEEVHSRQLRAVIGPDCAKVLVMTGPDRRNAVAPSSCLFEQTRLDSFINEGAVGKAGAAAVGQDPYYERLKPVDTLKLGRTVPAGRHSIGLEGDGATLLGDGWSSREPWGAWSQEPVATLVLPCVKGSKATLILYLRPFQKQVISISTEAGQLWHGPISAIDQPVPLQLDADSCVAGRRNIKLDLPNAVSPAKLGMSADGRILGVGLSAWDLQLR
jgi:hypothetical protein